MQVFGINNRSMVWLESACPIHLAQEVIVVTVTHRSPPLRLISHLLVDLARLLHYRTAQVVLPVIICVIFMFIIWTTCIWIWTLGKHGYNIIWSVVMKTDWMTQQYHTKRNEKNENRHSWTNGLDRKYTDDESLFRQRVLCLSPLSVAQLWRIIKVRVTL